MTLRCLIVDDSVPFLEAARPLLESEGVVVVDAVTNAAAAAEAVRRDGPPDIALVDVFLGEESGFVLARELGEAGCAVVMISTHTSADMEDLLARSPAIGFLPKTDLSAVALRRILGDHCPS